MSFSSHTLAQVVLGFGSVLLVSTALIPLFHRIKQPKVVAEIAAGIMLGPSLLGLLPGNPSALLFPPAVQEGLSSIAQVGILLFMFLVGWETDFTQLRSRRTAALCVSLASITLPLISGIAFAFVLYHGNSTVGGHHVARPAFLLFIGASTAVTAFPVLARIIAEHGLQSTPAGTLAMASAAVGDVLAWCMLALVSILAVSAGFGRLGRLIGWCAVFLAALIFIVRPMLRILLMRLRHRPTASPYLLGALAAGAFTAGFIAQQIGLDSIFGAFFFGLMMPRGSFAELRSAVQFPMLRISDLLLPVFFVDAGLSVNITQLGGAGLLQLAGIIGVACFGKLSGGFGAARLSGMSLRDSATVGLLMNTRGLTELIILTVGMQMGILNQRIFTMMVLMALITTGMAGPLLPAPAYASQREPDQAFTKDVPTPPDDLSPRPARPGALAVAGLSVRPRFAIKLPAGAYRTSRAGTPAC